MATLKATDPDDDPITRWSITGGADGTLFSLDVWRRAHICYRAGL